MVSNIDWNEAWKTDQASRRMPDDSSFWDKRAPSFSKTAGTSPYARTFIELAQFEQGDTVFDMGCGSGTLALPLARAGHEIWAADFSPVMVELMMRRAQEDGLTEKIHQHMLAWGDDWSTTQVPVCDVAVASRSIATDDLKDALVKLDSKARRRVCLTLGTNASPRTDDVITAAIGRPALDTPDFIYAMNILWQMGLCPTLQFIESKRVDLYQTREEAVEKFALIYNVTPEERERLQAFTAEHMHEVDTPDGPRLTFDHERKTKWAFISWDK